MALSPPGIGGCYTVGAALLAATVVACGNSASVGRNAPGPTATMATTSHHEHHENYKRQEWQGRRRLWRWRFPSAT